tara:strand:+ start:584 stop:1168 length:585 start_codon:yes stop_codon:yes gene_type:complete
MVISSTQNISADQRQFNQIKTSDSENKIKRLRHNGQIQIYQSSYRGSYATIIRDSLRNAALGRKVLLAQPMKGGVKQGVSNPIRLCGNLLWIRPETSPEQNNDPNTINSDSISMSIKDSIIELWEFCKKQLLSGEQDQVILDEIFRPIELGIIAEDDLISTLDNRFLSGDVILTGTSIPKKFLLMADQFTELRS